MEYKVIFEFGANALNDAVNNLISEGWRPIGGISVSQIEIPGVTKDNVWAQAMIKE